MPGYPRTKDYPEALVKILLTVMANTPQGGATLEDLQEAYREARGSTPSQKTISRCIRRLNLVFDPLAYGETPGDEAADHNGPPREEDKGTLAIQARRRHGETRYHFCGELPASNMDVNEALHLALGLYTQRRGLLKGYFQTVMLDQLQDLLAKIKAYQQIFARIEQHIHVSGYGPEDPGRNVKQIKEIMRAIHHQKRIALKYLRTYDGSLTEREVEPYGLICRFNNWYLVAFCCQQQKRRVFLLDNIRQLRVSEGSTFSWPRDFHLQETYGRAWGVWTSDDKAPGGAETVRLRVSKGVAERFRFISYHDSQQVTMQPGAEAEVTFTVTGANEMIPWLMSWGTAVEILEPPWLREALVETLQDVLDRYADAAAGERAEVEARERSTQSLEPGKG